MQQTAAKLEVLSAVTIGEKAVIADALETAGKDVHQKAADELASIEGHRLVVAGLVVLVAERDFPVAHIKKAVVGNGDAVGVAREVIEDRFGAGEWGLDVNVPFRLSALGYEFGEVGRSCVFR